jgi:hypothetical protein
MGQRRETQEAAGDALFARISSGSRLIRLPEALRENI